MSENKDTLLRLLATLQLIPRHPGRIATTTLQDKLADRGFKIDLRSLQRDLKDISYPAIFLCTVMNLYAPTAGVL